MDDFTDRSQFRIGHLLVMPDRLIAAHGGQEIPLQSRMMTVFILLAERPSTALSPAKITDRYLEDCRL
jgi:DNA-binding response OmpR family regulator